MIWPKVRAVIQAFVAQPRWRSRRVQGGIGAVALCALIGAAALAHAVGRQERRADPPRPRMIAMHVQASPTPVGTATPTSSSVPTSTSSPTATPRPSSSPRRTATATPRPRATPAPTHTVTASPTPSLTATATDTATSVPTSTPSPTPTIDPVYYAQDTLEGTGPGPAGPLSGLPTAPNVRNRRPIAVVLDNFAPDARPQTGLNRASLVFETLVEGGITRLMVIYLERDAPIVGPVRSARIYFDAWAAGLRAVYAHAGGNSDAMYQIAHMKWVADMDDLKLPSAAGPIGEPYWRSNDRAAPHNLYTATGALRGYAAQASRAIYGSYPDTIPHRVPDPYFHRPDLAWIDVGFSSASYNVHWRYDRTSNRYLRSVGGTPSVDPLSRRPVAPSNVVVLFTPVTPDPDPFASDGVNVHTVGTGRALYFRDGHLVIGTWRKPAISGALELLDPHGAPQPFNPGQTWIEVVPPEVPIGYHGT